MPSFGATENRLRAPLAPRPQGVVKKEGVSRHDVIGDCRLQGAARLRARQPFGTVAVKAVECLALR